MISKYLIHIKGQQEPAIIGYNAARVLCFFDFSNFSNEKQVKYILDRLPLTENKVKESIEQDTEGRIKVSRAAQDLSFENLWKLYDYKVKRERALAAYKKLSDKDKIALFSSLSRYEFYLKRTNIAKALLASYINDKRWEDEY